MSATDRGAAFGAGDQPQLDELQATERLLSRLGGRRPEPADLDDDVFGALVGLAREVDEEELPARDASLSRLQEALAGRPLWVMAGEDLTESDATRNLVLIDDPAWADERRPRVIDLTAAAEGVAADGAAADGTAETSAKSAAAHDEAPAGEPAVAARVAGPPPPREGGDVVHVPHERWVRVVKQLPLPVAAAIAVFAIGGGITSAMSGGDPMSPINNVVDQVAGNSSPSRVTYASVSQDLVRAQELVQDRRYDEARKLIERASVGAGQVSSPQEAAMLKQAIASVTEALPEQERPRTSPIATVAPVPAPTPSQVPSAAPEPTTAPTAEPTAEPTPTVAPTTPPAETTPPPTAEPTTPADEPSVQVSPADAAP